ncbi:MAG: hypothetical protein Ct9H90mP16_19560 [Candidatus Poseidoniales archaeon]|nr:MAG: hypothetical protein Ct9H90mP16_19560 [Candidatus Poseidoniales archaeon]
MGHWKGDLIWLGHVLANTLHIPDDVWGAGRDWWKAKRLDPRDKIREQEGNSAAEKKRALILLTTFMIAAGALTGGALLRF